MGLVTNLQLGGRAPWMVRGRLFSYGPKILGAPCNISHVRTMMLVYKNLQNWMIFWTNLGTYSSTMEHMGMDMYMYIYIFT